MLTSLNYTTNKKKTGKKGKQTEYLNLECAFDIETSSMYVDGDKFSNMYLWGFGLGDGEMFFTGRTWSEFIELLESVSSKLNLNEHRVLICYVHNLGYEFQFMRKYFEWLNVFSNGERKPLKALCSLGIEFRDSLILSGGSLEVTARNLQKHKIKKLVGDLDYSLTRHSETEITSVELQYLKNDVDIILHYINEQLELYDNNITKIPLTNTGRVRQYVKNKCYFTEGKSTYKSSKGKQRNYKKLMDGLTLNDHEYILLKNCFMGGFTHANSVYTDLTIDDVHSIDFTSSYPSVMVSEKFPMSKGQFINVKALKTIGLKNYLDVECCVPSSDLLLNEYGFDKVYKDFNCNLDIKELEYRGLKTLFNEYCCMLEIELSDVKNVFHSESYLSEHKCLLDGERLINNGRVYNAENVKTVITDVDFEIIEQVYDFKIEKIYNIVVYRKNYLPKPIVESVLELYQKKTELKDVKGKESEYQISKGMLNSIYGMTVTDIVRERVEYSDDWSVEKPNLQEEIENYNEQRRRFLFYPWGVWITAYARKNLWTGILNIDEDYIYSDTDSLKFKNYEEHREYIEGYNKAVLQEIENCLNYHKLDTNLIAPKTVEGTEKPLGVWDYEGHYSRFKTLGAKRYIYEEDGEINITVAGLPKNRGTDYLLKISDNDNSKVFENFTDKLKVPAGESGKLTHCYIDIEKEYSITDYRGVSKLVKSLSSVHLEKADFSMNLFDQYVEFYNMVQNGEIWKGEIKRV